MDDSKTIVNSVERFTGSECRVCLQKCNDVWQIFHPTNLDIGQKLMEFAAVQVEDGDGLPTTICYDCRRMLDVSYEFKLQVEKSDAKLRREFMLKESTDETSKQILSMTVNAAITEAIVDEIVQEHRNDMVHCAELQTHLNDEDNRLVAELNGHSYAHHEPIIFRIEPPSHDSCVVQENLMESEICSEVKSDAGDCQDDGAVDDLMVKYEDLAGSSVANPYKSEPMLTTESELSEQEEEGNENDEDCRVNERLMGIPEENENVQDEFPKLEGDIPSDCFTSVEGANNGETIIQDVRHNGKEEGEVTEQSFVSEEKKSLSSRTRRYECPHCVKTFATRTSLERHTGIHEEKNKTRRYVCHTCDERFSSITRLRNHASQLSHECSPNDERNGEEPANEVSRRGEKRLSRNADTKRNGTRFVCKICDKQFTYQKSFLTHAKTHPDYEPETGNNLDGDDGVVPHGSDTSNERGRESDEEDDDDLPLEGLQCTQCGKLFATKRNLKRHISTHGGLKFHCSTCSKEFSRIDKLKEHEQSKHREEFFASSDTDSDEDTDNEGKNHDGSENRKKEKLNRPYKCSMCPKAFAQEQSLTNHEERHKRVKDTQKRFLCEVCSKCFAQSGSLVAHMRTHTGVKPYVCNVCSRAFTKSTYLQLHLRTHSGEKPYICQYCSRAFARANTLARHITMHTGEAKYHCQICMKSFRRLTSLNEHTYTHTGQRPYACKICTKRYNNAGSLYAHTKKCKTAAQQTNSSTAYESLPVDDPINRQVSEDVDQQTMIYAQRKLTEDSLIEQTTPTSQFIISSNHGTSFKTIPNNIVPQFTVEEPNFCSINVKSYKNNSYYTIYPNM